MISRSFLKQTIQFHLIHGFNLNSLLQFPPIRAVLGGFSQASKLNEAGAFTNLVADEQSDNGKDIQQFGQLLATLLGYCHGSSEYTKVDVDVWLYVSFRKVQRNAYQCI